MSPPLNLRLNRIAGSASIDEQLLAKAHPAQAQQK